MMKGMRTGKGKKGGQDGGSVNDADGGQGTRREHNAAVEGKGGGKEKVNKEYFSI